MAAVEHALGVVEHALKFDLRGPVNGGPVTATRCKRALFMRCSARCFRNCSGFLELITAA
jgi:hypothetical protein